MTRVQTKQICYLTINIVLIKHTITINIVIQPIKQVKSINGVKQQDNEQIKEFFARHQGSWLREHLIHKGSIPLTDLLVWQGIKIRNK